MTGRNCIRKATHTIFSGNGDTGTLGPSSRIPESIMFQPSTQREIDFAIGRTMKLGPNSRGLRCLSNSKYGPKLQMGRSATSLIQLSSASSKKGFPHRWGARGVVRMSSSLQPARGSGRLSALVSSFVSPCPYIPSCEGDNVAIARRRR